MQVLSSGALRTTTSIVPLATVKAAPMLAIRILWPEGAIAAKAATARVDNAMSTCSNTSISTL